MALAIAWTCVHDSEAFCCRAVAGFGKKRGPNSNPTS